MDLQALPKYRCHKEVRAARIVSIDRARLLLLLEHGVEQSPHLVKVAWLTKHDPHVGGYLVVYEDGYTSFSPAQAFEEGYERISPWERDSMRQARAYHRKRQG